MEPKEDAASTRSDEQGQSQDDDEAIEGRASSERSPRVEEEVALTFPQRLMEALMDGRFQDILSWDDEREDVFIIHRKGKFTDEILPRFFKKSAKFSSFVRKLTRWGFVRISKGTESAKFVNPLFRRGNYRLLSQMSCNSGNQTPSSTLQGAADSPATTTNTVAAPQALYAAGPAAALPSLPTLPPTGPSNSDAATIVSAYQQILQQQQQSQQLQQLAHIAATSQAGSADRSAALGLASSTQPADAAQVIATLLQQQQQPQQQPQQQLPTLDAARISAAYQEMLQRKQAQELEVALRTSLLQQRQQEQTQSGISPRTEQRNSEVPQNLQLGQLSLEQQLRDQLHAQQLQAQLRQKLELVRLLGGQAQPNAEPSGSSIQNATSLGNNLSLPQQLAAAATAFPSLAQLSVPRNVPSAPERTAPTGMVNPSAPTAETKRGDDEKEDDRKPPARK